MILHNIYFSAKGTTKICADCIANNLALNTVYSNLLSSPCAEQIDIPSEDVLLFTMPVYGGVIPRMCAQMAENLKGDQTPAIIAAVYGNRHYDNALLQMKDILKKQGFVVIAAGAFLAEHSIFPTVAAGRPDTQDIKAMADFSENCKALLQSDWKECGEIELPGDPQYDPDSFKGLPFKPDGDDKCVSCGMCADACPVKAISKDDPRATDATLCINCGACIKVCPTGARNYHNEAYEAVRQKFEAANSGYRLPEVFYAER